MNFHWFLVCVLEDWRECDSLPIFLGTISQYESVWVALQMSYTDFMKNKYFLILDTYLFFLDKYSNIFFMCLLFQQVSQKFMLILKVCEQTFISVIYWIIIMNVFHSWYLPSFCLLKNMLKTSPSNRLHLVFSFIFPN